MKAMAKDPNARFQSAAELAAELKRFQDGKPLTIRPPTVLERFGYWARTNRQKVATLAAMCAVTFLAAIIIAIVSIRAYGQIQLALQSETEQKLERSDVWSKAKDCDWQPIPLFRSRAIPPWRDCLRPKRQSTIQGRTQTMRSCGRMSDMNRES